MPENKDNFDLSIDDLDTDAAEIKGGALGRIPSGRPRLDRPREIKRGAPLSGGLRHNPGPLEQSDG